jgi:hypothetical protein
MLESNRKVTHFQEEQEKRNEGSATAKFAARGAKTMVKPKRAAMPTDTPTSPFELVDNLVEAYAASRFNSLAAYCESLQKANGAGGTLVLKTVFIENFKAWCMQRDHNVMNVEDHHRTLQSFRLSIEPRRSAKTEVFIKILWKQLIDIKQPRQLAKNKVVGENSLDKFIRSHCQQTNYEYDHIFVEEFTTRYTMFCTDAKLAPEPLRDREMAARGCARVQKRLQFVVSEDQTSSEAAGDDDDDEAASGGATSGTAATAAAANGLGRWATAKLTSWTKAIWAKILGAEALWVVTMHMIVTVAIPMPLLAICFFWQQQASIFSYQSDRFFVVSDAVVGPRPQTLDWGST